MSSTLSEEKSISMIHRLRRNRQSEAIRNLCAETHLLRSDFVVPFFLIEGRKKSEKILSMPGVERLSMDLIVERAMYLHANGIQAIAIFPVIDSDLKNPYGDEALNPNSLIIQAIRFIKKEIPTLCLITDIALDPFTSHGHDGLADDSGKILNDETVRILGQMALLHAEAGVDIVAPSDMMDGRVQYIRTVLDQNNFQDVSILSYSAKYASSLYSPFRDALDSTLRFGDKKTYQMNPANSREAILGCQIDDDSGADILMIKPASLYLDIIFQARKQLKKPICAYHVSGEYAMVMAAHEQGFLDANRVFHETLLSIKRAGADMIFTYAADRLINSNFL